MKGLTIFSRTTKKEGTIKLRFRLRDGRDVDLYHKSAIKADLKDLSKFTPEGNIKPRVSLYNRDLKTEIELEIAAIEKAYRYLCTRKEKERITQDEFEVAIEKELHPEKVISSRNELCLLDRFLQYIDDCIRDGIFGSERGKHYRVTHRELERFLKINKKTKILPRELDPDMLMEFRNFLFDEYRFVKKFPSIYDAPEMKVVPLERRGPNTVATKMKKLQAFYNELVARDEVLYSPFTKLGKQRKQDVMREQYDDPICLTYDEFMAVYNATDIPSELAEVRDCFVLHCAFGCRIGEFKALSMENVAVDPDGIPYIHYIPEKTSKKDHTETVTPIMRFALDLIKKWKFSFSILKYVSGKSGYNAKIKTLLDHCGIDREVTLYDEKTKTNLRMPLYKKGSSKLCRKTFVDMIEKVQIDKYAAGLHKKGSTAVERYTYTSLKDRFKLYSAAFGQQTYKVDKKLNVIEENTDEIKGEK